MLSLYSYYKDLHSYRRMPRLGIKSQAAFSTAAYKVCGILWKWEEPAEGVDKRGIGESSRTLSQHLCAGRKASTNRMGTVN